MKKYYPLFILHFAFFILTSCSIEKQISKSATAIVLRDSSLTTAHVGISFYEPATNRYWYNYNGDHYFVPASNTKIPTCYAAMKYLGDSLVGLKYVKNDSGYLLQGAGDPSFLLSEFSNQPVLSFFKRIGPNNDLVFSVDNWKERHLGSGWAWNDYNESYMAERSAFPVYGNVARFTAANDKIKSFPSMFDSTIILMPGVRPDSMEMERVMDENIFLVRPAKTVFSDAVIPYRTFGYSTAVQLLNDTLIFTKPIKETIIPFPRTMARNIYSQPTDSLLKPMMHRSDNFFAEQALLMVSNERLGTMSDEKIIDTLLKTDLKDLPQKPRWADGSGLSRYNLFTPQDFVFILNKMKSEFAMERIKVILPTGNEGTLDGRFVADSNYIFAKTGTLSGVVALSGFLYTKKNRLLIFSVLVNNHNASASSIRRAVERFIQNVRKRY